LAATPLTTVAFDSAQSTVERCLRWLSGVEGREAIEAIEGIAGAAKTTVKQSNIINILITFCIFTE
jgi:hypothetical protein